MTLGEPYAGKPPVRFDEGRRCETGTDNHGQFNPAVTPRLLYWQTGRGGISHNPVGIETVAHRTPKVARASQPWALGQNPVGI